MRAWLIAIAAPPAGRKATSREESPYANAVLRSVNVTMALAAPGIVAVWTAAEIADLPPIDFRDPAPRRCAPIASRSWRGSGCAHTIATAQIGVGAKPADADRVLDWFGSLLSFLLRRRWFLCKAAT